MGFRSVLVKTDSLRLVKQVNSVKEDISILSPIVTDIQALKGQFENITYNFMRRSSNMAAYTLAAMGKDFGEAQYWVEEVPPLVETIVRSD